MYEWTDPDAGTVWEMYYDVPQGNVSERECVMFRVKGTNTWHELPPFAMPPTEAMEQWHGRVISHSSEGVHIADDVVEGVPASILSDLERIDTASTVLGELADGKIATNWHTVEPVFDALSDARTGLLYLVGKLNDAKKESK